MNNVLEAAYRVLTEAGQALHYEEITRRILKAGYWRAGGKTPQATVNAQLSVHINKNGVAARFRRVGRGLYDLNHGKPVGKQATKKHKSRAKDKKIVSFTDAAERVLKQYADRRPMHYRKLTEEAKKLGLIATAGRTPEASMYASVFQEIQRKRKRGEQPRFQMHGKGLIGLVAWLPKGLVAEIQHHNRKTREALHKHLHSMTPGGFENLIGRLLGELGFEEVEVTARHKDGGVDVRGTLVVGEVIRTRMAVQAKKWTTNLQAPIVQQVRGSLGTHEQGLIITTSDFSKGAVEEASRPDAVPVGLMNGETLVGLLIENNIGVRRTAHDLIELADDKNGTGPLGEADDD